MFLSHPNITQLYTFFSDSTHIYLVMELCVDGNLSHYKRTTTSDTQKHKVVLGTAKALEYMHEHRIRHGDLKLENVLLSLVLLLRCRDWPR
jgi:cell cycle serine/threonine-protein kinase CDC5/MSD2